MDAVTNVPQPVNAPVHDYAPGSPERQALTSRLEEMAAEHVELTMTIGGEHRMGGGEPIDVVPPHNHKAQLGTLRDVTADDVRQAVDAATPMTVP
jgi:1-pyrroline-5-carboxylate dehydrogenase